MISRAQIEKLGALHAVEPTMLSLYLAVPPSANLTARAGELITAAEAACGSRWRRGTGTGCWGSCHRAPVTAPGARWPCSPARTPACSRPSRCRVRCRSAGCLACGRTSGPCYWPGSAARCPTGFARRRLVVRNAARRTVATMLAMPPAGRPAVGLPACLAAVSAGPVQTLVVPADGLVPGYECGRCGTLSLDADACCPDWGVAALPVPDVIEEMVSRVLEDGGDVLVAGGGW